MAVEDLKIHLFFLKLRYVVMNENIYIYIIYMYIVIVNKCAHTGEKCTFEISIMISAGVFCTAGSELVNTLMSQGNHCLMESNQFHQDFVLWYAIILS